MRRHRVIIINKKDMDAANKVCAELYGEAALKTFTIPLLDEKEAESKFWCCWSLGDKELKTLLKSFDKAKMDYDVYEREKTEPAKLLKSLKLHLRESKEM